MDESVIDAVDWVQSRFESNDAVSYAEVGGITREVTDAVITDAGVRTQTDTVHSGVWWRQFTDGTADYRYTTMVDESQLDTEIERSIRSARLLAQSRPASVDAGTTVCASHPGWGPDSTSLADVDTEEKVDRIQRAIQTAIDGLSVERTRSTYRDELAESVLMTTNGTAVSTTTERASADTVIVPTDGQPVRDHFGSTSGSSFLETLAPRFDRLAARARRVADTPSTTVDRTESVDVILDPLAAGELIHQLAHYLEIDTAYIGASSIEPGEQVASALLSVDDTVEPGSWAARAYDAEGRPCHPVSLIQNGVVRNRMYDTSSAIEENAHPAGNFIPSLGLDQPPRIHARHLSVHPGGASLDELQDGMDLRVTRFGTPRFGNEATRTKRASGLPPSSLYAKDIEETTPAEYDDESTSQTVRFPIEEGYRLRHEGSDRLVTNGLLEVSLPDLQTISAIGSARETLTGTCEKHRSTIPYAVTTPAISISATLCVTD
ncbi:metallopeptidase TldD-related protein [Halorarum halobium]|uniref:metallopeptidase TldD-related protein n=1 Tax=Halorarum halobium TaxID=3075121 RepID=UPI0028A6C56E|nr:metallopeptidase TldD-related protein [Halobaculum sp. XH14]